MKSFALLVLALIFSPVSIVWGQTRETAPASPGQNNIKSTTPGPWPWIDVTDPSYGAKCDGATDDTQAIQAALKTAGTRPGGATVLIPASAAGPCLVSSLTMDKMIGVKVTGYGGFASTYAAIQFTGTCSNAACLLLRSTNDIEFSNLKLAFPKATSGPLIDLSHSPTGSDTSRAAFHHVAFMGPGLTVGPIINDAQTDFVTFDNWTSFSNASVFVTGPTNNSQFTDSTVFNNVQFYGPGTAAIENASASWTISASNFGLCNAANRYAYALNFVAGYNQVSNLLITGSSVVGGSGRNCNTAITYFRMPPVTGNAGAVTFTSNLITGALSKPAQTFLSVNSDGMSVNVSGNTFSGLALVFAIGTGATLDVGANVYFHISSSCPASLGQAESSTTTESQ